MTKCIGVFLKCNLDQKEDFKTTPDLFWQYFVHLSVVQIFTV